MSRFGLIACVVVGLLMMEIADAQERKLDRIRVGGGSTSATQMSML
jgi:hypothetical protein